MKEKQFEDVNTCQGKQDLQGKVQMRIQQINRYDKEIKEKQLILRSLEDVNTCQGKQDLQGEVQKRKRWIITMIKK